MTCACDETEDSIIEAAVRNPDRLRDPAFYAKLSPKVLDRIVARLGVPRRLPACIYEAVRP